MWSTNMLLVAYMTHFITYKTQEIMTHLEINFPLLMPMLAPA